MPEIIINKQSFIKSYWFKLLMAVLLLSIFALLGFLAYKNYLTQNKQKSPQGKVEPQPSPTFSTATTLIHGTTSFKGVIKNISQTAITVSVLDQSKKEQLIEIPLTSKMSIETWANQTVKEKSVYTGNVSGTKSDFAIGDNISVTQIQPEGGKGAIYSISIYKK